MALTNKEKIQILISQAISVYSARMQEGKIPEHRSVIDFISKNIPEEYRSELSMELIDDVFSFVSDHHMELS
jgi:urease gamma subunit